MLRAPHELDRRLSRKTRSRSRGHAIASYLKHRKWLLGRLADERGEEFVRACRGLLDRQLNFLAEEGLLLTDVEFERMRAVGENVSLQALLTSTDESAW